MNLDPITIRNTRSGRELERESTIEADEETLDAASLRKRNGEETKIYTGDSDQKDFRVGGVIREMNYAHISFYLTFSVRPISRVVAHVGLLR